MTAIKRDLMTQQEVIDLLLVMHPEYDLSDEQAERFLIGFLSTGAANRDDITRFLDFTRSVAFDMSVVMTVLMGDVRARWNGSDWELTRVPDGSEATSDA